jgi:hypothetical protein
VAPLYGGFTFPRPCRRRPATEDFQGALHLLYQVPWKLCSVPTVEYCLVDLFWELARSLPTSPAIVLNPNSLGCSPAMQVSSRDCGDDHRTRYSDSQSLRRDLFYWYNIAFLRLRGTLTVREWISKTGLIPPMRFHPCPNSHCCRSSGDWTLRGHSLEALGIGHLDFTKFPAGLKCTWETSRPRCDRWPSDHPKGSHQLLDFFRLLPKSPLVEGSEGS